MNFLIDYSNGKIFISKGIKLKDCLIYVMYTKYYIHYKHSNCTFFASVFNCLTRLLDCTVDYFVSKIIKNLIVYY